MTSAFGSAPVIAPPDATAPAAAPPPAAGAPTRRPRLAWRPVGLVAAGAALAHLVVLTRFGWHRDELYYVVCGHHLAWGYPDQPPLAPALARLASAGGLVGLRLVAVAAYVGCVLAGAALAAELGGRRRAQTLAAAAVAACPVFVGASLLFGTTVLDQLAWALILVLVARALRVGTLASWIAAGVAAGVGLENKQTVAVLMAGVLIGLAVTRRPVLRTPGPWVASAVAAVLWMPNLMWDATHHWANLAMASRIAGEQGGLAGSLAQVPLLLFVLAGPFLVVLWWTGCRWLWRDPVGAPHRWLLAVAVVALVLFTAGGGKPYYPAPAVVGLFAAGAVAVERATAGRRIRTTGWPAGLAVSFVVACAVSLPWLPPRAASALRPLDKEVIETYGWPQMVGQVARAVHSLPAGTLPPHTVLFTSNYGEAGALSRFGPGAGLHMPVASGHNGYGYWGPPTGQDGVVVFVGQVDAAYLQGFWSQVTQVGSLTLPAGITDEETASHAGIFLCRGAHGTWAEMWPRLRHLD